MGKAGWPWTSNEFSHRREYLTSVPSISIVTPTYNQAEYIEETIRSVLLQGYPNLEYFIMDGGSNDGTVEIIRKYEPWLSYWQSGPDDGQSDAINKGLKRSNGDWFHFINSDDVLCANALQTFAEMADDVDIVAGAVEEFGPNGNWYVPNAGLTIKNLLVQSQRHGLESWHQPGVIMRRALLEELGGYPTELQYVFDYETTCRYLERYPRVRYSPNTLVNFRIHDDAKSSRWKELYLEESILARKRLSKSLLDQKWQILAGKVAEQKTVQLEIRRFFNTLDPRHLALAMQNAIRGRGLSAGRMVIGAMRKHPSESMRAIKLLLKREAL